MIISSSNDGKTNDEVEGDNCPAETDCSEGEPLFIPSTRSILASLSKILDFYYLAT